MDGQSCVRAQTLCLPEETKSYHSGIALAQNATSGRIHL
jgi:hypothetical protein